MTTEPNTAALKAIPATYAQPDPSTLATLPRGGVDLLFQGHAEITLALIEIDPLWNWRPMAFDVDSGGPAIEVHPKRLVMWGYLTVHGVERPAVGTCEPSKGEPEKELIGDLLRNGAMRFGVATKLWSKATDADPASTGRDGFNRGRKTTATATEPTFSAAATALYERVAATAGSPLATTLKEFATANGRKLTAGDFDADPVYAEQVAAILDTPTEVAA